MAKDVKKMNQEFKTVDYEKMDNSRNVTLINNDEINGNHSLKHPRQKDMNYIKNRRTGSSDCTSNKLNKKEIQKIQDFDMKDMIELENDEIEIIVSNRKNDSGKVSISPSPEKYDIVPMQHTKKFQEPRQRSIVSNYDPANHKKVSNTD